MADPITNQQFVASLFSPGMEAFRRMNSQRVGLAEVELRRRQQLQDQATEGELRTALQGLVNRGAMDRVRLANEHYDTSTTAANTRQDKADKSKVDAERRRAYAAYVQLGGDTPLNEFSDGEDGIGEINVAAGKLQLKGLRAKIKIGGEFVKKRTANLRALVNDRDLESQATALAVKDLSLNASGDNAADAIKDISAGRLGIGLKKLTPEDRAMFDGLKQKYVTGLRAAQYKDPQVVDAIRGVRDAQASLMSLVQTAPSMGATDVTDLASLIPDVDEELGLKAPGAIDFGKFFSDPSGKPPPAPAAASSPSASADGYGGVAGAAGSGLGALRRMIQNPLPGPGMDGIRYAPGTIAQMIGGDKLADQADETLAALNRARPVMQRTGSTVWRAILRSLLNPQPAPNPAGQ